MKNTIAFIIIIAICVLTTAQTQMQNNKFEEWTTTDKGNAVPKYWHSYGDGDCQLKGIYSWGCGPTTKNHSNRVTGHTGYGCEIYSISIAGNLVNGVLTTGQMQFASPEDNSPNNYTYTDKDNKLGHKAAMAFTGRPDSVYFWCKFEMKNPSNVAIAKFHLHGNIAYRDLSGHSSSTAQKGKIGNAFCTFKDPNDHKWHQYKFKFTYYDEQNNVVKTSSRTPSYILACFSTNKITKGGSNGDKLIIDDIVMIYNKRLSYIEVNGEQLPGFNPDKTDYTFYCDNTSELPVFTAEAQSPNATVRIEQPTADNNYIARIIVTHDDGEKEYRINVCKRLVAGH